MSNLRGAKRGRIDEEVRGTTRERREDVPDLVQTTRLGFVIDMTQGKGVWRRDVCPCNSFSFQWEFLNPVITSNLPFERRLPGTHREFMLVSSLTENNGVSSFEGYLFE